MTPTNISTVVTARASGLTGITSPMPVLDSSAKLRNISSVQVRGDCGSTAAEKLPGCSACTTTNRWAKPQASSVKVAPAAKSSSVVACQSLIM